MSATLLDKRDNDGESIGFSRRCAALLYIDMAEISILVQFCAGPHARRPQFLITTTLVTFSIILFGMGSLIYQFLIKHLLEEIRTRCWYEAGRRDRNEITQYEFDEKLKLSVAHELRLLSTLWNLGGMETSLLGVAAFCFWVLCIVAV
jgi:hypothetical protein